jgi:hypothetical protein
MVLVDYAQLIIHKKQRLLHDSLTLKALQKLELKAEQILKQGKIYSVINKKTVPPSGDKHDYMSQAPYWWADPTKPDGKPYIRKDGLRNPEINDLTDHDQFDNLMDDTEILALAYFYTDKEVYAQYAAKLLNTWFLDKNTKMNPNLNFGQGIPGINTGRGIGIIETRNLLKICDAAILLSSSNYWGSDAQQKLKKWFSDYTQWLLESPLGKDEADEHNNHGTYYSVQIVSFALFIGDKALAKSQMDTVKIRIQKQFKEDGSQPFELARTLPYDYASMNLEGFCLLAMMAKKINVDLWNFNTTDGKSIKKAIEWFIPFIEGKQTWSYKQLKPPVQDHLLNLLKMTSNQYGDASYFDTLGMKISAQNYADGLFQLKF